MEALKQDERNETAWLWLSGAVDNDEERAICLENVLTINPANERARRGLEELRRRVPPPAQSVTCPFCGASFSIKGTVCPSCGESQSVSCPSCYNPVGVEAPACPNCGQKMADAKAGAAAYYGALGDAYQQRGNWDLALKSWQHALDKGLPRAGMNRRLAEAYRALGRSEEAVAGYRQALQDNPDDPETLLYLIEFYTSKGDAKQADEVYRQAVSRKTPSGVLMCGLGDMALRRGSLKNALKAYEAAAQANDLDDEGRALVYARMGRVYDLRGEENRAVQSYRRTEALAPNSRAGTLANRQLADIRPSLPAKASAGWSETLREMSGPMLSCALLALMQAGFDPALLTVSALFGFMLAVFGIFLLVCAFSTPRNDIFTLMLGREGLSSSWRWAVGGLGALVTLVALMMILLV